MLILRKLTFALLLLAGGCASNPFGTYYVSRMPDGVKSAPQYTNEPYHLEVKAVNPTNIEPEILEAQDEGYLMIGMAIFNSGKAPTMEQLQAQAEKVNARLVIFGSRYAGEKQGTVTVKWALPKTLGLRTTTSVYDIETFDYVTTFWHMRAPGGTGMNYQDLHEVQKQMNHVEKGVPVNSITRDSPGGKAGFMVGDVITAVNDQPVTDKKEPEFLARKFASENNGKVKIDFVRNGEKMVKYLEMEKQ